MVGGISGREILGRDVFLLLSYIVSGVGRLCLDETAAAMGIAKASESAEIVTAVYCVICGRNWRSFIPRS